MCDGPYDYFYPAYGGVRQRADMTCGRVGSAFQNAEAAPGGTVDELDPGYGEFGEFGGPEFVEEPGDSTYFPPEQPAPSFYDNSGVGDSFDVDGGNVERIPTPAEPLRGDAPLDLSPSDDVDGGF